MPAAPRHLLLWLIQYYNFGSLVHKINVAQLEHSLPCLLLSLSQNHTCLSSPITQKLRLQSYFLHHLTLVLLSFIGTLHLHVFGVHVQQKL